MSDHIRAGRFSAPPGPAKLDHQIGTVRMADAVLWSGWSRRGRQNAFYGWIDLTAQLEALITDTGVSSFRPSARAGRGQRA